MWWKCLWFCVSWKQYRLMTQNKRPNPDSKHACSLIAEIESHQRKKKKINRGPKLRRGKGSRKSARGDLFVPGLFCCPSLLAVAGLGTHARVQLGLASCWLSQVCPLCDSSSNDRKIQGQARAFPGYLPAAGASWGEELPWVPQEMFLCSITPLSIFPNSIQAQGVRNQQKASSPCACAWSAQANSFFGSLHFQPHY